MTLFDPDRGRVLAADGIARAGAHADHEWMRAALTAVLWCAVRFVEFTTDEVVERLNGQGVWTHEPRALGAVMRQAAKKGWVVPTDRTRPTSIAVAHRRPKRIWRSLAYVEADAETGTQS